MSLVQKKRQAEENDIGKQGSRKNWNLYLTVASVVIVHGFERDVKALVQELSQSPHSCLLSVVFSSTFAVLPRLNDTHVWLKNLMDLVLLVRSMEKYLHLIAASGTRGLAFMVQTDVFAS